MDFCDRRVTHHEAPNGHVHSLRKIIIFASLHWLNSKVKELVFSGDVLFMFTLLSMEFVFVLFCFFLF